MKQWLKAAMPLAVGLMLLGLASCEGDVGPQGPPGVATCMNCHTDEYELVDDSVYYLRTIQTQFALSRHNLSDTYVRGTAESSAACSRCHSTEGYQTYIATGESAPLEESSHIGCFACHAPHTFGDFGLRKEGATAMTVGTSYDKAESNTCAVCHQARAPEPAIDDEATLITSYRWGTHYGPQSNVLSGQGAWVLPGAVYRTNATHNAIANGCVTCHMANLPDNAISGGHSFAINYSSGTRINSSGCREAGCHLNWTGSSADQMARTDVNAVQDAFNEHLDELRDALFARGWVSENGDSVRTGAAAPLNANDRGVVWNYKLLHYDLSDGVHNPRYAEDVIAASLDYLAQSAAK